MPLRLHQGCQDGRLRLIRTQPASLVDAASRNYPSEIQTSSDGQFVYVANRGVDTIAAFSVVGDELRLTDEVPTGGPMPRHFTLAGAWMYIANQGSDTITALQIGKGERPLRPTDVWKKVVSPACVLAL